MQEQLTIAGENYYKALDEHEAAVQAVADAQARIDEANAQIAELQDKLSKRARSMYRSGQTTALDAILGATTFEEFATSWDLLERYQRQRCRDGAADERPARRGGGRRRSNSKSKSVSLPKKPKRRRASKLRQSRPSKRWKPRCNSLDAEAQALLVQEQEAARAAEAAAAAAEVKRTYAYSTPSASIPVPGLGGGLRAVAHRLPLVWGAAGPNEFDCSGLVTWAYAWAGISVPHQTESMYYAAAARLPVSEAQPGDVLWISYGDGYNGHAGIA